MIIPSCATQFDSDSERHLCRQARLAKDARFDGVFFVGVFSTGIYCRPICPAVAPKEENVKYFSSAVAAASAGLRPCLRCRPDSAPHSFAWKGTQTTVDRAVKLIDEGAMSGEHGQSVEDIAARLGISARYLRRLFQQKFGTSPKHYAVYKQLLFAKQLLHQTQLSITDIALASGFTSIRRFNQVFKDTMALTPSELRRQTEQDSSQATNNIELVLYQSYRPPLDWARQWAFYQLRAVDGMEWLPDSQSYGRSFSIAGLQGIFLAEHEAKKNRFKITVNLVAGSQLGGLSQLVNELRRILDLDADMLQITNGLSYLQQHGMTPRDGLRIPGAGSTFEALCRAILGQQVSVVQATKLLSLLVQHYGETITLNQDSEQANASAKNTRSENLSTHRQVRLFPTPEAIANASLDELKMPGARKLALNAMAQFLVENPTSMPHEWLGVKGIGPWTVAYAQMRGMGEPNIFLATDLIVKKRLLKLYLDNASLAKEIISKSEQTALYKRVSEEAATGVAPWGSYLTFQLWSLES